MDCTVCRHPHDGATKLCERCLIRGRACKERKRVREGRKRRPYISEKSAALRVAHPEAVIFTCKRCDNDHLGPFKTCSPCRARARRWKKRSAAHIAAYRAEYARNHRQDESDNAARTRVRRAGAVGRHSRAEWLEVLRKHKGRCAHCSARGKLTKDHVIPLSRGGSDFAFNLQPLCAPCNSKKSASIQLGAQHSLFDRLSA